MAQAQKPKDIASRLSDSQKDVNSYEAIEMALATLRLLKPSDKSSRDRSYAVTITMLEQAYAYFYTFVYQKDIQTSKEKDGVQIS